VPETDPAPVALEELRTRTRDAYLAFERAQEPNAFNGHSYGDYYSILFDPSRNPRPKSVARFEEFEAQHRGTAEGLEALITALGYLRYCDDSAGPVRERADGYYTLLVNHYLDFEGLGDACYLGNLYLAPDDFLATMDALIEGSPHRSVRAKAIAAQLHLFQRARRFDEQLECVALLQSDYADVPYQGMPCGELAERSLVHHFEDADLAPGQPAPELSGYDLDGNHVALSDFEGQVVVAAFIGFW